VSADAAVRFAPERPLDLSLTLGPIGYGPSMRHQDGAVWRATRTPEGAATIRLVHRNGEVEVEGWGPGAEWAVAHAPALCGEEDDDSGFVPGHHPLVARLHREIRGVRLPRTQSVFEAMLPSVILQLVTTEQAKESYRHLVNALGETAPGPVPLKLPPSPQVLSRTPYWSFHRFGIERRRAETIIRTARSANRLEEIVTMDRDDAYSRMLAFPGVGPWTAAKVATVALGDPDAVPVGDYHLPHLVGYALEGTPRSTDERMLELLEPYTGHRARVIRLLILGGVAAPRFGPKQPLRDIRHQ
jgi:3-methyladenine DNA glycosylase/8-oxoguanine DNA glycosylase